MPKKRIIKFIIYFFGSLLALLFALWVIYYTNTRISEPEMPAAEQVTMSRTESAGQGYACENGWLRRAGTGWWLMYLEGTPYEMGYAHGLLTEELMAEQEAAFTERLAELIPGKFYQNFMLAFVRYFNRDLEGYILPEFKEEIFGISRHAPEAYDFIGPAYARMLNYHAAHDLGHAVQNMNLVACTAFGAWDGMTADSGLIVGRNFDFYINDDFAANKILCFARPDSGYSFVSVTWAGFAGVVSGMNDQGLTITLNAAKSSIPLGARTPVSLLAREILQYASDIEEALEIARSRETFVAESFLIGSAKDHKVVVIEKSPEMTAVYDPDLDHILLTNHFQSDAFANDELNIANIKNETSLYRLNRLAELVSGHPAMTVADAAAILRDYRGLGGRDIGLGNEKAVNQFIAHHSVIFRPDSLQLWISSPPWQLGEYRGFDIGVTLVAGNGNGRDVACYVSTIAIAVIPPDSILSGSVYRDIVRYRDLAKKIESGEFPENAADSLMQYNPGFFHASRILGDHYLSTGQPEEAIKWYQEALNTEAPSVAEKEAVEKKMGR
jgi:tetratricopeptide (TPR) repeat protein